MKKGKLYLIPVSIGNNENLKMIIPSYNFEIIGKLRYFIVEKERTARRFISIAGHPLSIDDLTFYELNKHDKHQNINFFLEPVKRGFSIGLMSEAGTPAIADPGSLLVAQAHQLNIEVVPLVGPNSILLALMASGFNGQGFAFHGYLPIDGSKRFEKLKDIENDIYRKNQTQIFIETPYRTEQMLTAIIKACNINTKLSIACDLTLKTEWIKTLSIARWQKQTPTLRKRLAVFLLFK